jgi:outer membrane protein assembly factor BamB
MIDWRLWLNRLALSRVGRRGGAGHQFFLRLGVIVLALLVFSGCGRGLRHESWPGLIVDGDTLYAANLEHIQALNAETGKIYWSFPSDDTRELRPFYSTPVLVEEFGEYGLLLVAGFTDRTVYALQLGASPAERPDELWRFAEAGGQYVGTGVVADDLFIIGNGDGKVYALAIDDGSKVWEFATQGRVWATPVVIDETVYIASMDHHLYALDLQTGEEVWQLETGGAVATTPVHDDGTLWIGDFISKLYQVDLEQGEVIWTFQADDWLWATPLLDDARLFFADVGGQVYALDVESKQMLWDEPASVGDTVHAKPTLSQDGGLLIVAGHERGQLHAVETETGAVRENWATTVETPGRLPSDLVSDGERLYAMPILVQDRVRAFDLNTGTLLWTAPESTE